MSGNAAPAPPGDGGNAPQANVQVAPAGDGGNAQQAPIHPIGALPEKYNNILRQADPRSRIYAIGLADGLRLMNTLLWNLNVIMAQQTYNTFNGVTVGDPPVLRSTKRWVVPGRLFDGATINTAPKNRDQFIAMDIDGWYAIADHYGFDWRDEELSLEHCRARWDVWCGCRTMGLEEAANGYVAPAPAAAAPAAAAPAAAAPAAAAGN